MKQWTSGFLTLKIDYTERKISLRLSQLALFRKFLNERLSNSIEKEAWSNDKPEINKQFIDSSFYRTNVAEFLISFGEWLKEMSDNKRGFSPFNPESSLDALIQDRTVKQGFFSGKVDFAMYDSQLSRKSKGKTYRSPEQKLINLFFQTTEEILTSKFGLKN